jgi:hypothetical protein
MKAERRHTLQTSELKNTLGGLERARKSVGALLNGGFEEFDPVTATD